MNEPHDGCGNTVDVTTFGNTLQGAVNAIRRNGATSQYILLPGKFFEHPSTYTNTGGAGNGETGSTILSISDATSSKAKLIIDVHQYLDSDGSGNSATCTNNALDDGTGTAPVGLRSLATWLANNGRQAFVSEIGAGNNDNCVTLIRQTLGFMK